MGPPPSPGPPCPLPWVLSFCPRPGHITGSLSALSGSCCDRAGVSLSRTQMVCANRLLLHSRTHDTCCLSARSLAYPALQPLKRWLSPAVHSAPGRPQGNEHFQDKQGHREAPLCPSFFLSIWSLLSVAVWPGNSILGVRVTSFRRAVPLTKQGLPWPPCPPPRVQPCALTSGACQAPSRGTGAPKSIGRWSCGGRLLEAHPAC